MSTREPLMPSAPSFTEGSNGYNNNNGGTDAPPPAYTIPSPTNPANQPYAPHYSQQQQQLQQQQQPFISQEIAQTNNPSSYAYTQNNPNSDYYGVPQAAAPPPSSQPYSQNYNNNNYNNNHANYNNYNNNNNNNNNNNYNGGYPGAQPVHSGYSQMPSQQQQQQQQQQAAVVRPAPQAVVVVAAHPPHPHPHPHPPGPYYAAGGAGDEPGCIYCFAILSIFFPLLGLIAMCCLNCGNGLGPRRSMAFRRLVIFTIIGLIINGIFWWNEDSWFGEDENEGNENHWNLKLE